MLRTAMIVLLASVIISCNRGNGLTTFTPVTPAQAGPVVRRVSGTTYYVHLHPLDGTDLTMLQKIHDQWHAGGIRMEYDPGFGHALYDSLVSKAHSVGLKIAFITPYTTLPVHAASYAQAAGAVAKRYAGGGITWEIYNEPDLLFGEDKSGVANYVKLAKPTALAIRANDATAIILTGGTSGRDPRFSFAMAAGKALAPYVDGVAIHPYGVNYDSFGAAIVAVSLATGAIVYVTEWSSNGDRGLGEAMTSAKGFTPMFCAYEYQEQPSEKLAGDPIWGLLDTGAWSGFAIAAQ